MKLQDILGKDKRYDVKAIAADRELTRQIQIRLIDLGLLDPPADGIFGPVSTAALNRFHKLIQCTDEPGFIGAKTAGKLIEAKRSDLKFPPPVLKIVKDTFLLARPIDVFDLSDAEKQKVEAGKVFELVSYEVVRDRIRVAFRKDSFKNSPIQI